MAKAYKILRPDQDEDPNQLPPIGEYPINAAICRPSPNQELAASPLSVQGYALPPGSGARIERVEVSIDLGAHWQEAVLSPSDRPYCWRLWEAKVDVIPSTRRLTVRARSTDGTSQPETVEWNSKGYLYNAWHNVPIRVVG